MNNANIRTKSPHNPEIQLDSNSGKTARAVRPHSAGRTVYPQATANNSVNHSLFAPHQDRQVREDKSFYIPDPSSDAEHDANPRAYSAATDHAKHLHKAEASLDDAWNLVRLMLAALGEEGGSLAMQTKAGLKAVEKKLNKAHGQIDKHDTRHRNLFFAYFDLKNKADGEE